MDFLKEIVKEVGGEYTQLAADIDETLIKECVKPYNKVIALGNEVAHYFKKKGIDCFHAPHPSPRNRKFNDKSYESTVINGLQKYIHMI